MNRSIVSLVMFGFVASCASSPNKISAQYISPLIYQNYSCEQVGAELQRIGNRVSEVTGQQQRAANSDAIAMGVGLVLFWPALFFLAGDNNKKEELSRLKGEYDALQQAGTMKNCFVRPVPQQVATSPVIAQPVASSASTNPQAAVTAPPVADAAAPALAPPPIAASAVATPVAAPVTQAAVQTPPTADSPKQ